MTKLIQVTVIFPVQNKIFKRYKKTIVFNSQYCKSHHINQYCNINYTNQSLYKILFLLIQNISQVLPSFYSPINLLNMGTTSSKSKEKKTEPISKRPLNKNFMNENHISHEFHSIFIHKLKSNNLNFDFHPLKRRNATCWAFFGEG